MSHPKGFFAGIVPHSGPENVDMMEIYEEFKVAFNQDENKKFHRLFEEEYTIVSMPNFFFLLIDLAKFLLRDIKGRVADLGKDNKD